MSDESFHESSPQSSQRATPSGPDLAAEYGAVNDAQRALSGMLPDWIRPVYAWVSTDGRRSFEVLECDEPERLDEWRAHWTRHVDLEIVPVVSPRKAEEIARGRLAAASDSPPAARAGQPSTRP